MDQGTGAAQRVAEELLREPWVAEQSIIARLAHHKVIDDADGVAPEVFVLLAMKICQFKRRPVTDHDMAKMKKQGGQQTERRKALNLATSILHAEITQGKWRSFPSF